MSRVNYSVTARCSAVKYDLSLVWKTGWLTSEWAELPAWTQGVSVAAAWADLLPGRWFQTNVHCQLTYS